MILSMVLRLGWIKIVQEEAIYEFARRRLITLACYVISVRTFNGVLLDLRIVAILVIIKITNTGVQIYFHDHYVN